MSRGKRSSLILIALFVAFLTIVLPVSADNVTVNQTTNVTPTPTVTTTQTGNITPTATATATPTTNVTPTANVTTTRTTNATPTKTKTTVTTVVTTAPVTQQTTPPPTTTPPVTVQEIGTTGSVMVYSSPTGASILIDGVYSGTTPRNVNGVPAGNHILRLELSGYNAYEGSIYIVPGETAQGYGTLQPIYLLTSAAPTTEPTGIVPVVIPIVTASPQPTKDTGLLGNTSVLTAIIGAIAVLIAVGASIFIHITPPKKE